MNRFQCVASVSEREAIRYTPAGIPVLNLNLQHSSRQHEAGIERLVELEIPALAAGEMAERLSGAELGVAFQFTGFLARKNRNSKSFIFHITGFEPYF